MVPLEVMIPYTHGELAAAFHEHGFIVSEDHLDQGTHLIGRMPVELAGRYRDFWYESPDELAEVDD